MPGRTIIATFELPDGRQWVWFEDLDMIGLAPGLTEAQRQQALDEVSALWRHDLADAA